MSERGDDALGHRANAVLDELGVLVGLVGHVVLVGPFREVVDAGAHRIAGDFDEFVQVDLGRAVALDGERGVAPL